MPKKSKQLQKPYKGKLNKPLLRTSLPETPSLAIKHLISQEAYDEGLKRYEKICSDDSHQQALSFTIQKAKKFGLLFEHYDIDVADSDRWFLLSMALAENHVLGFKIEAQGEAGRPQKWDDNKLAILYYEVELLLLSRKSNPTYGISWACAQLVKKECWSTYKVKTLQTRYSEAKKSSLVSVVNGLIPLISGESASEKTIKSIIETFSKPS